MRDDPETAEALHVLDHVPRFAAKRIRRGRHADGDVVAALCAQLYSVDDEHPGAILWSVCFPRAIAVVGKDDEVQTCASRSGGDLINRARSIRTIGVNVK
jgi:hypothetical protein